MKKAEESNAENTDSKNPKKYLSQSDVPGASLENSLRVASAISDNYGKDPTKPLRVADAMKMQPGSSYFRKLCGVSIAYGLTEGGYNANLISLTSLGRRIVAPTRENDDLEAKKEAILKPRVFNVFLTKYNNEKLPTDSIAFNVLEEMGVPRGKTKEVLELIMESAEGVDFIKEIGGKKYVDLESKSIVKKENEDEKEKDDDSNGDDGLEENTEEDLGNSEKQLGQSIFLAHGKNKKSLEQIKTILGQFNIPFKVATEEPNLGRPISGKVRETMQECNCAILLFTADEEFKDSEDKIIWRPSENVVYELGACSYLYENRVVIIKDDKVQFPANFKDLGYISFSDDNLNEKSMDIVKELIGFGILKITTG
jgi:predicted nucleotide-binding protein